MTNTEYTAATESILRTQEEAAVWDLATTPAERAAVVQCYNAGMQWSEILGLLLSLR